MFTILQGDSSLIVDTIRLVTKTALEGEQVVN